MKRDCIMCGMTYGCYQEKKAVLCMTDACKKVFKAGKCQLENEERVSHGYCPKCAEEEIKRIESHRLHSRR